MPSGGEMEGGADQRERVRYGERRDDRQDLPPAPQGNDQAQKKKQMIEAGQDMLHPEPDETACGAPPRRIERNSAATRRHDQRPAFPIERLVANRELERVAELGCSGCPDRHFRIR